MTRTEQVAIVIRGGLAGLAAALRLKMHNGIDTAVYELRSEPTTLGGAVNIPSNGLRLLDQLGVFDEVTSRTSSASELMIHSLQGHVVAHIDMAAWSREKVGFGFVRIVRAHLLDVLLQETRKQNIPVHFGKCMTCINETDDQVTISFADGTTVSADMLLACDGIHSAVRQLHINPDVSPEYTGISNMFTILPTSRLSEDNSALPPALHATLTRAGLFGLMPCTADGDHLYWFYSRQVPLPDGEDDREGWEAYGKKEIESFKDIIREVLDGAESRWADQLREIIQKTDTIKFYPIYKMPLATIWSTKRCLLLGDAAHAMQPHVGQGTSTALEDAFLLSRLLGDQSHSLVKVFREYEAIRRPRVEAVSRASAENGEIRKTIGPWTLMMKEIGLVVGFWLYKIAGLQKWGTGLNQKDYAYDIMTEPIWPRSKGARPEP
ncbi:hypothetical protein NM208_g4270 [Fusarium decemcellulare]|uniref:Uncharacterized protein n=1 Tax=Fusarium decemcellulare TaxID=57161 RepID=A0ACC1SLA4_9HYPO|nr:hypothetical protein NM208_g4270 [Fusarium decemcellulare]